METNPYEWMQPCIEFAKVMMYLMICWVTIVIQVYRHRDNIPLMLMWLSFWQLGLFLHGMVHPNAVMFMWFATWPFALASLPAFGQHRPMRQVPQ
jgi:hypothetical protein